MMNESSEYINLGSVRVRVASPHWFHLIDVSIKSI